MKESLSQQQQLRQQQRLTPMQVQFVRMLEMTGPEVENEVSRAIDDMPALEVAEPVTPAEQEADAPFTESAEEVQAADYGNDDETPTYMLEARNRSAADFADIYRPDATNDEMTLMEWLNGQLDELDLEPQTDAIARYITGNLDTNGYLRRSPAAIADDITIATSVDISPEQVEEALAVVRSLDPAGVAAVDLRDCLLLQLKRRQADDPAVKLATEIIEHYFDLFSKKHYADLAAQLHVDKSQLAAAIDVIARLNPKPGNQHGDTAFDSTARQIVPEFLVETDGGDVTVTLLNNIPELTLSATFTDEGRLEKLPQRQRADALTFMRTRRDEAAMFIRTLKMRQSTLFNVMAAIADIQRDFFLTGDETRLRPMILRDIADRTGYDLSVISRATASKYVSAPSGTYPLKFFFNERHNADEDVTYHQIAAAMKKIIDAEDKNAPLSDEALTKRLTDAGFAVARRTVSKYRERLGFPVARLRRTLPT